jgi:tetratricopeptide (TPR) repeat protein
MEKIAAIAIGGALLCFIALGAGGRYLVVSYQRGVRLWGEGVNAASKGEIDRSIDKYNQALREKFWPAQLGLLYRNRGIAFYQKGRFDDAIRDLTEAINRTKLAAAYSNRSLAYLASGRCRY